MSLTVIILAGGLGTRLQHLIPGLPKSMAPVNGKPFLAYQLAWLKRYSVTEVILSVGYLHEKIIDYFGTFFDGISIQYIVEDEPLGTGGAVLKSYDASTGDILVVMNGDTIFDVDLDSMLSEHEALCADISVALREVPDAGRYGSISVSKTMQIINFFEKDKVAKQGLINGGLYLINRELLSGLSLPSRFSLEKDLFPILCKSYNVHGFFSTAYFLDIGIPSDYYKAQSDFKTLFTN